MTKQPLDSDRVIETLPLALQRARSPRLDGIERWPPAYVGQPRSHQRGWIGLVALLVALLIVAVLAQTLLRQSGLIGDERSKVEVPRAPADVGPAPLDPSASTPVPRRALDRARGLEAEVHQQAQDMGKQIDEATK